MRYVYIIPEFKKVTARRKLEKDRRRLNFGI